MKRLVLWLIALSILCASPQGSAGEMNPYRYIISSPDGLEKQCLTASSDLSVRLRPCRGDDFQLWIFESSVGEWSYVKNKVVARCLFTGSATQMPAVRLEPCTGEGYQSYRLWKVDDTNGFSYFRNKFVADWGAENYLQVRADGELAYGDGTDVAARWKFATRPYREVSQLIGGVEECLAQGGDATTVQMEPCTGLPRQRWISFLESGSWSFIRNQVSPQLAGKERCLKADAALVAMGDCTDAHTYTSLRLWRMEKQFGHDLLLNKYIGDLSRPNYLRLDSNKRLVFGARNDASTGWQIDARSGEIRNVAAGQEKCLTASLGGGKPRFLACGQGVSQIWRMTEIDRTYAQLSARAVTNGTLRCLDLNADLVDCGESVADSSWARTRNPRPDFASYILANKRQAGQVLVSSNDTIAMVPSRTSDDASWVFDAMQGPGTGYLKVLLLHTSFSYSPPTDLAAVRRAVFGDGDDYFSFAHAVRIASNHRLSLTGDVVTGLILGPKPENCNAYERLLQNAIAFARVKGYDRANYDFVFMEMPPVTCRWAGMAASPGTWVVSVGSGHKPWMWQHEFGHNLGAPHADSLQHCPYVNNVVQIGATGCTITDTSDPSNTMNGGGSRLYPVPYRYFAKWIDEDEFPEVTANGTYRVAPLFNAEGDAHGIRGLRIARRDGTYLTIEYRQAIARGFDNWSSTDPFVNGLILRIAKFESTRVQTILVDANPVNAPGNMQDAPLMPGRSADDVLSGKRITLVKADSREAEVEIQGIP